MSLFVAGLGRASSTKGTTAMLIGDMYISRLMNYVQQVENEKPRHRKEHQNKKAKIGNVTPYIQYGTKIYNFLEVASASNEANYGPLVDLRTISRLCCGDN